MKFLALCVGGVEKLLKDEIKALGYTVAASVPGKVFFEAPWEGLYKANLWLRTAETVLWVVGEFPAGDFDQLFEGVRAMPWRDVVPTGTEVVVEKVRCHQSRLTSLPRIQAVVQKAVYTKLDRISSVPGAGTLVRSPLGIRVYLDHDVALVGLNSSGESLHRRGYRKMTSDASLKETLGAALLLFSGWRRKFPLIDPFCGSGTIPMEALLFGRNIAPGLHRRFAFEQWTGFQKLDWDILRDEAREKIQMDHPVKLFGSDKDPNVIHGARSNAQAWGFEDQISFEVQPMEAARAPEPDGFLITNPPYGERLETREQAETLMRQLRSWERRFPGYRLGVISPLENLPELLDREPFQVRTLKNGPLDVRYFQFLPK